ncbi:oxygen-dependent coproporphyrinogen oxidase [Pontibacter sp. BT310]|uniref:coproporphyrinogen oxidase n=1 Tax=Pontibacter populi TaxID=890055 RepID=A0ABS6XFX5_9BACT|nr:MULTISPECIES: oxygen-dependent coproporphyrinogen oxidase [Pontibacter]MBJ6120032.1 oxygen-dependent coproporphyrinogen oxidase [Pontibacter sp. BT310]MBR0572461.1 oxygen-dependent coproporphyrinogen oxidase [Microvirga sp. STS03]MBW3366885.1 oxygen-dependent coproporphyrinogen oxidase [Pontibacter populi]
MFRDEVEAFMRQFQLDLVRDLETCDGGTTFQTDEWQHAEHGGGITRIIEHGAVLEKGGVNFSAVGGQLSPQFLKMLEMPDPNFFATGVSVVMHPHNPMVPITHMNVRYFEAGDGKAWFGGGIDLTPIYLDLKQAQEFHKAMKAVCDKHHPSYYPEFKKWADDYFFNVHRNETRGVGGIFFDRLMANDDFTLQQRFEFVKDVAYAFAPFYTAIINQNRNLPYNEEQKKWQLIRRGRYVEFNLVYDRGTKFGLMTGGRIESILMSLPELASWVYNHQPVPGSPEEQTLNYLKKDIDWINVL